MSEAEARVRVYVGVRVAELGWLYSMSEAEGGRGRVYVGVRVAELGWLYLLEWELLSWDGDIVCRKSRGGGESMLE